MENNQLPLILQQLDQLLTEMLDFQLVQGADTERQIKEMDRLEGEIQQNHALIQQILDIVQLPPQQQIIDRLRGFNNIDGFLRLLQEHVHIMQDNQRRTILNSIGYVARVVVLNQQRNRIARNVEVVLWGNLDKESMQVMADQTFGAVNALNIENEDTRLLVQKTMGFINGCTGRWSLKLVL